MKSLIKNSFRLLYQKNVPQVKNSIKIIKSQCFNKKIKPEDIKKFKKLVKMRSIHYPVQYLCHDWPFRLLNLRLKVPILIPRFQSQYMVQVLIQKIKEKYKSEEINQIRFVQYGCGSGALGLSLIKQLKIKGKLIDINQKCIRQTCRNSKLNQINSQQFELICGDMCLNLDLMKNHQIIISNPPYLSEEHFQKKIKHQVKKYQDKLALVADHEGMFYIEKLLTFWTQHTRQGIIILEFDGRKLEGNLQWAQKHVITDQYGKRRFILIEK